MNDKDIKLIYIAGALRGNTFKKWLNIRKAKNVAETLWRLDVAVYSPHLNSGWLDSPETDVFLLPANIDIMLRCDAIYVMDNWRKSEGTKKEITEALRLRMPVYFNLGHLLHDIKMDQLYHWGEKLASIDMSNIIIGGHNDNSV